MLNFLLLGRALIHPQGLVRRPGVPDRAGRASAPLIDTTRLVYDGGSQGGIMGGALTAIAPDFERAVLGVPAMNYSTLLRRSVDFDTYAEVMYTGLPRRAGAAAAALADPAAVGPRPSPTATPST